VRGPAEELLRSLDGLAGAGRAEVDLTGGGEDIREAVGRRLYRRLPEPKGPMHGFGYSYLEDHLEREEIEKPALLEYKGLWGGGGEYAYEALNLVDGKRTVREVRDALAAIYGPVPLKIVAGYLQALEEIGVLKKAGSLVRE
jgi:hypothetical protein